MDATGALARTGRLPQIAKYEVLEEIGHGGMATVYRAHDPVLARDVAIKVIHPHLRDSAEIAHRFSVEARAVAKLRHPNILEVFDVSREDEPEQYLVVELLRGLTLRKLLQKRSPLAPEVAASIGVELASALSHAHQQDVIHRDTKPENVILERRDGPDSKPKSVGGGEGVLVKLTDFGIAKLLDAQGVTSTGQVLGSPAHMAPEQIEGGDVDARADVFALGVLLYECMVGHLPFEGNNPAQVLRRVLDGQYPSAEAERSTVGKPYSAVLDRALAHVPADRFSTAAELGDALTKELARLGVDSPRAEIVAWLDDADAYEATNTKRLIDRLCANAGAARKRGDAISSAADYNRALAYAPDDPALLKIVTGMQRREARRRALWNGGRAALVMALVGSGGFFVTRLVRDRIAADHPTTSASASVGPVARTPMASAVVSALPTPSAPPSSTASMAHIAALPTVKSAAPATKRDVAVDVEFPPNGVLASLDGAANVPVSGGYTFNVDSKPHSIVFTCVEDLCVPKRIDVPVGDDRVPLSASLTIRPASLVVHGDANASYQILQLPQLAVRAEAAVSVPLKDSKKTFTVVQLPSGKKLVVELAAGKRGEVTFTD